MLRWALPLLSALCVFTSLTSVGCAEPEDDDEELVGEDELAAKKKRARRFDVIQHNIGGGAENVGTAAGLKYTFSQIDAKKPDVVMLEEVCAEQYEAFKAKYPKWTVHYTVMRETHEGCANRSKGHLLASPRAMDILPDVDLGEQDGDKMFRLSCGYVGMPGTARKVLSCVTHLRVQSTDPDGSLKTRQVGRIAAAVRNDLKDGRAVVIGGDLNIGPQQPVLDQLYRVTRDGKLNGGKFDEADQTDAQREKNANGDVVCAPSACRSKRSTTKEGRQIDYVFFSHNRAVEVGAQALGLGGSGHKLYHAWARIDL